MGKAQGQVLVIFAVFIPVAVLLLALSYFLVIAPVILLILGIVHGYFFPVLYRVGDAAEVGGSDSGPLRAR